MFVRSDKRCDPYNPNSSQDMKINIYDNSNIAESYSGVTTPLTYSFSRFAYQEVYKNFCRMMGVDAGTIARNEDMYSHMVVFIGYRMYYDLDNWYKLVSFLPGYKFNKVFFEKMLSVQKTRDYTGGGRAGFLERYFIILPRLIFQAFGILFSFIIMGRHIRKFNGEFDRLYDSLYNADLADMSMEQLQMQYFRLHEDLASRWRVPIANDFAVMVSAGIADKLSGRWLNGTNVYSYFNSRSHVPLTSLDPGSEMLKIAALIRVDPGIFEMFNKQNEPSLILSVLKDDYKNHPVTISILGYLKRYGCRSPNELKLETVTLNERPEMLIELLRPLVDHKGKNPDDSVRERRKEPEGHNALNPVKRALLERCSIWAARSIARREETRFRRALIFGYARTLFLAMGKKFIQFNLLDSTQDIFYLTTEEIFKYVKERRPEGDIRGLVAERKAELEFWRSVDLPRRIETPKSISEIEKEFRTNGSGRGERHRSTVLKGVVASRPGPNIVSGTALVLQEFDPSVDYKDKILITKQTDPGWTIVFPLLKGLVVERGGVLSHAAIVARELNIPCLIGVDCATESIIDGSPVNINLIRGEVYG